MADHFVDQVLAALKSKLEDLPSEAEIFIDDDYLADEETLPRVELVAEGWGSEQKRSGPYPALMQATIAVSLHCIAVGAGNTTARKAARALAKEVEAAWCGTAEGLKLSGIAKTGTRIVGAEIVGDALETNQPYADCRLQAQIVIYFNEGQPDVIVVAP